MRLFVAIWLNDDVRTSIRRLQDTLRPRCADVRWTPVEQTHMTVKFLGEVADARVPEVSAALNRAARDIPPFDMTVVGTGCFPPRGAVRIIWAGVDDGGRSAQAADRVDQTLSPLGFEPEKRAFSPHITIGRVREDRSNGRLRDLVEGMKLTSVVQSVGELRLMSSVLGPRGSSYDSVGLFPFRE